MDLVRGGAAPGGLLAVLTALLLTCTTGYAAAIEPSAAAARVGLPVGRVPTDYPSLPRLGPRPQPGAPAPVVYRKVADGDWRVGESATRAPFRCANGGRDIIVHPGDKLVFGPATFESGVNVGPVWNYSNDNAAETTVVFEDCTFKGGVNLTTVGKMKIELRHSRVDGMFCATPSPDSLVTLSNVAVVAAHGGDAARIGRPRGQTGYRYGPDSLTPVTMRDCLIRTSGPSNPGDHRDAMQVFGGAGISFTNVVFDLNYGEFTGPTTGQNVALFIEDGSNGSVHDIEIVDCWMLGSGSYFLLAIQCRTGSTSTNINLVRPRLSRGTTPLYGSDFPAFQRGAYKVDSPVYSDNFEPVALSAFGR